MVKSSNVIIWTHIFKREMLQSEKNGLLSLLRMLGNVVVPEEAMDSKCWGPLYGWFIIRGLIRLDSIL